jgi:hypothetical protein
MVIADAVPHRRQEKEWRACSLKIEKRALSSMPAVFYKQLFCFHGFRWQRQGVCPYAATDSKGFIAVDNG